MKNKENNHSVTKDLNLSAQFPKIEKYYNQLPQWMKDNHKNGSTFLNKKTWKKRTS